MSKSNVQSMTSGSPLRLILVFMIPLLLGNLVQQFYNIVDAMIVGRLLGADALAAVGASSSVQFLVLGFSWAAAQASVSRCHSASAQRICRDSGATCTTASW